MSEEGSQERAWGRWGKVVKGRWGKGVAGFGEVHRHYITPARTCLKRECDAFIVASVHVGSF